jgi:hypothetical protein
VRARRTSSVRDVAELQSSMKKVADTHAPKNKVVSWTTLVQRGVKNDKNVCSALRYKNKVNIVIRICECYFNINL